MGSDVESRPVAPEQSTAGEPNPSSDSTVDTVVESGAVKSAQREQNHKAEGQEGEDADGEIEDYTDRPLLFHIIFISTVVSGQALCQGQFGSAVLGPNLAIAQWLGTSDPGEASWMPASYGLTLGVFVLLWGSLGDIWGSKNMFILGYLIMVIANIGSGFCSSPIPFDICRAIAGIGGAAVTPNAAGLLGRAYPPGKMRMISFSILGALSPTGALLGGVVGSWMVQTIGARWIYFFTAIMCAGLSVLGLIVIPRDTHKLSKSVDYFGFAIGGAGLILFNFSWNQGPLVGWSTPYVYALMIVGLFLIAVFVIWEKHLGPKALLPPAIFNRESSLVLLAMWFGWMSFGTFLLYTATFLREMRGLNPLSVAAEMSPLAPGGIGAALLVIWLFPRLPGHVILAIAMAAFCIGNLLMSLTPHHQTYWAMVFPAVCIEVFGPDLSYASASLIVSNSVPRSLQGSAAGLVATIVNYSLSIGLGMSGTIEHYVARGDPLRGLIAVEMKPEYRIMQRAGNGLHPQPTMSECPRGPYHSGEIHSHHPQRNSITRIHTLYTNIDQSRQQICDEKDYQPILIDRVEDGGRRS